MLNSDIAVVDRGYSGTATHILFHLVVVRVGHRRFAGLSNLHGLLVELPVCVTCKSISASGGHQVHPCSPSWPKGSTSPFSLLRDSLLLNGIAETVSWELQEDVEGRYVGLSGKRTVFGVGF